MASLTESRKIAFQILNECRRRNAFVKALLDDDTYTNPLSLQDRGFVSYIVLGVTGVNGHLDLIIDKYLDSGVYVKPEVRIGLKIAIFEMLYMNTPVSAATSQGVELCEWINPHATALANALLRQVGDNEIDSLNKSRDAVNSDSAVFNDYVTVSGLPGWLLKKIKKSVKNRYKDLAVSSMGQAPVYVAVDPTNEDIPMVLEQSLFMPEVTCLDYAYKLTNPKDMDKCELFDTGDCVVSDLASQVICTLVSLVSSSTMLEIGQGRATKTMMIEALTNYLHKQPVSIVGVDSVPFKKDVAIKRTSTKWSYTTTSVTFDATKLDGDSLPSELDGLFDVVFCDVPCTGTGTMRRHPEIAWTLEPDALNIDDDSSLVSLQRSILQAASTKVESGGYLVYSTCSVLREENAQQVKRFLGNNSNFEVVSVLDIAKNNNLGNDACKFIESNMTSEGYLQTCPSLDECDGHFACFMKKNN